MFAFVAALNAACLATVVSGQAYMVKPMTFLAPDSGIPSSHVDYNIQNPLFLNGTNYPCKGYHHSSMVSVSEVLKAGEVNSLELIVGASNEGGTCELSLSYDNGLTFRVFKRIIGGCPVSGYKWITDYTIPEYAPSGSKVIFSWTWFPLTGDLEMWQSCSFVEIQGFPGKEDAVKFQALPPLWRGSLYEFSDECVSVDRYHLFPPLIEGVEIEISADDRGVIPKSDEYPYPFSPGQCDNDKKIASSWAYEMMDGINTADCNLEPMVPCSSSSGWPTRQVYVQACMSQEPPVGWLKFPVECGGQGPIPEDGSLGSTFLIDQSGYL